MMSPFGRRLFYYWSNVFVPMYGVLSPSQRYCRFSRSHRGIQCRFSGKAFSFPSLLLRDICKERYTLQSSQFSLSTRCQRRSATSNNQSTEGHNTNYLNLEFSDRYCDYWVETYGQHRDQVYNVT